MKERPILFSGPMVRALLAGAKTQTRRVVNPQPHGLNEKTEGIYKYADGPGWIAMGHDQLPSGEPLWNCPYGHPGDRLWVRETAYYCNGTMDWIYAADGADLKARVGTSRPDRLKWRPSIYMPRLASRINLEVTAVRVERLQDISEGDAKADGIESSFGQWKNYTDQTVVCQKPVASYRTLWESINGPGSWDANPWVWVVEFKRVEK